MIYKYLSIIFVILFALNACTGQSVTVIPPSPAELPPPEEFRAGAAETDITPPPGLPLFGYSIPAENKAKGYWTRLKSRAIVFEYRKGNVGKFFALVQLDWGAVSGLLYWKVAARVAKYGFAAGDFLITASHTHAAPGGFFGVLFYNAFGAGGVCLNCYIPVLVDWVADQIALSMVRAVGDLKPAVIGAGDILIEGISRNRSPDAWIMNFTNSPLSIPYSQIIPRFHLLRIDHISPEGGTVPRAAFILAPLHATAIGVTNELYHGDLFGVASRHFAALIKDKYGVESFVAAVAPGPQGDVSPNYSKQGIFEAKRIGLEIASNAAQLFDNLKETLKPVDIDAAYIELSLRNAPTTAGSLSQAPVVGAPVVGGAEDGRSPLYGSIGAFEGNTRFPKGDQGTKVPLGGDERFQELTITNSLPDIGAIQVVRLGDVITLATLPGEPTTETGRLIKEELEGNSQNMNVALVGLANEYVSYITTCPEYLAQHYEGAFTLYGENEFQFFLDHLVELVKNLGVDTSPIQKLNSSRTFNPGSKRKVFNPTKKCDPCRWQEMKVKDGKSTFLFYDEQNRLKSVEFYWKGLKKGRICGELPTVYIECNGATLINCDGVQETDHWLNFVVTRKGSRTWCATWTPPDGLDTKPDYCIKVERPGGGKSLCSACFRLIKS